MKKVEMFIVGFTVLGILLSLFFVPYETYIFWTGFVAVCLYYGLFGFGVLNGVVFADCFKKSSYDSIGSVSILMGSLAGFAIAMVIAGVYLKLVHLNGNPIIFVGLLLSLVTVLICLIIGLVRKKHRFIRIYTRIIPAFLIGVLFLFLTHKVLVSIQYRNYPEYRDAMINYLEDPYDEDLRLEVEEYYDLVY